MAAISNNTRATLYNLNKQIYEHISARLKQVGVPQDVFISNLWGNSDTHSARLLFTFHDPDIQIEKILNIGVQLNYFKSIPEITRDNFFKFLDFLISVEGQTVHSRAVNEDDISTLGSFTEQEKAWLSLFQDQKDAFDKEYEETRKNQEQIIAFLDQQLTTAKEKMDIMLDGVRDKYMPAGDYPPYSEVRYYYRLVEIIRGGNPMSSVPIDIPDIRRRNRVYNNCKEMLSRRDVLDFLNIGISKQKLRDYAGTKILEFDSVGDNRSAKRCRCLLSPVGPPEPIKPLAQDSVWRLYMGPEPESETSQS